MPDSHTEIYLHLVWTTYRREPLLRGSVLDAVHRSLYADCRRLGVEVVALGGIEDHVHLLARVPVALTVPQLAHQLKGSSSHFVRHAGLSEGFGWQEGYSAFSVSRWDVPKLRAYIEGQAEHHRSGTAKAGLEPAG